jgi:glyoxylase-like metal-dependent hydrolase (beta-lactamase superfamily II)
VATENNHDVYRFRLGDFECMAVKDSSSTFCLGDLVPNAEKGQLGRAARALDLDPDELTVDYNCLLVRTREHHVLVDAGWGDRFEGREGKLLRSLGEMRIKADDVDWIVVTHGDRDHISGILDGEGWPVFVHARYALWQGAWDFWSVEENYDGWPEETVAFITGTYARIQDRLSLIPSKGEFLPGFQLIGAAGHRYDHSVVKVSSGRACLLHLADAVVHPLLMARREWYSMFDVEPEQAVAVKGQLLDWAAAEQALVFGTHFPFPAVGTVRPTKEGWEWLPVQRY